MPPYRTGGAPGYGLSGYRCVWRCSVRPLTIPGRIFTKKTLIRVKYARVPAAAIPLMIPAFRFLRRMARPAVAAVFAALLGTGLAAGKSLPNLCKRWPQNRLTVDAGLELHRFKLEPAGEPWLMERPFEVEAREIYHRSFILSLDIAEPVALFEDGEDGEDGSLVIARDRDRNVPLRIPVFYIGRTGQPAEEVKADAERAAFAASGSLSASANFADISFYLKRAPGASAISGRFSSAASLASCCARIPAPAIRFRWRNRSSMPFCRKPVGPPPNAKPRPPLRRPRKRRQRRRHPQPARWPRRLRPSAR